MNFPFVLINYNNVFFYLLPKPERIFQTYRIILYITKHDFRPEDDVNSEQCLVKFISLPPPPPPT